MIALRQSNTQTTTNIKTISTFETPGNYNCIVVGVKVCPRSIFSWTSDNGSETCLFRMLLMSQKLTFRN